MWREVGSNHWVAAPRDSRPPSIAPAENFYRLSDHVSEQAARVILTPCRAARRVHDCLWMSSSTCLPRGGSGPSETGALCALALHYWRSGCAPLPTSSVALQRLSKAHPSAWYRYNKRVLSTLPGVLEAVEVLYRKMAPAYHARAQHLRRVRPSGSTAKAAKSPEAQRPPIMTEPGTVQGPLWPTREPAVVTPRDLLGRAIPARVKRSGHAPQVLSE